MLTPAELALAYGDSQAQLAAAAAAYAGYAWARVDPDALSATWMRELPAVAAVVAASQLSAATQAQVYVAQVVASQGLSPATQGMLIAAALAGIAADGRDLASLLYRPMVATLLGIRERNLRTVDALRVGHGLLDTIVRTEVADAGRTATQVAASAYPEVTGYTRMLRPPSCSRCILLAGRWYRWSSGFQRHPRCLPAGVVVSGPQRRATTRRFYQGELVVITTASGQQLPVTGNHPVLTDRGWLPANLIQEGDNVVRSTLREGARPLTVPSEHQMPTRVEDLWRPNRMLPLVQVPTAPEDFHGDGGHGDVDVVLANRLLRDRSQPTLAEHSFHQFVSDGMIRSSGLALECPCDEVLIGVAPPAGRVDLRRHRNESVPSAAHGKVLAGILASPNFVSGLELVGPGLGSHLAGAYCSRLRPTSDRHRASAEDPSDWASANAEPEGKRVLTLPGDVGGHYFGRWQDQDASRWDAPALAFTVETRAGYAERGKDLLLRLSGQVELDRVVERRRVPWSGHVYNLSTVEGWYQANSLIVSNCDCFHVPGRVATVGDLRTDPAAYFRSLSREEQDRIFTNAGAQAIRDGADIGQVVNARRGMYVVGGRRYTRESTTRRGVYRRGGRRWMPEEIYRRARDRDEALELLRRYGYIH